MKLSVYFGDAVTAGPRLAADALMERLAAHGIVSALLRGSEGYGLNRRLHAERFPDISTDLPLLALAVASEERIHVALDDVHAAVPRGLVTLEPVRPDFGSSSPWTCSSTTAGSSRRSRPATRGRRSGSTPAGPTAQAAAR